MHTFSKNAKEVLPKINFQVWLIIRERLQRTILNKNIKRLNRIELKIGKPLLNFRRNSNFYFASLSQQQRRQSINFRTKSASPVRWSAIFMEHVVITKPTFSADENRNEGTIMTGCKAKFIARLLCPRSLNRRNPNVKGLRYSFDAANLFSLSLSLSSRSYTIYCHGCEPNTFSYRNRLEKTSFGGIVNARALSFYRDISIIHDCSRPPERRARIPVIKQRGEHVDVDVGAANVKIETLLEICRIVRRSLILARVLSLIYPVIRSSSRLIGSLV